MSQQAIGLIETRGLVALVEGTDAMLKSANVELSGPMQQVGNALVSACVTGDVAAVKAATDAGAEAVNAIGGEVVSVHEIARPHSDVATVLPKTKKLGGTGMFLARVEGSVVATKKDEALSGRKLLLVRPQLVDESDPAKFRPGKNTIIAVDSVGAGEGELIMFTQGSSARLAPNMKSAPVDAVVVGIVDTVDVLGQIIFDAKKDDHI